MSRLMVVKCVVAAAAVAVMSIKWLQSTWSWCCCQLLEVGESDVMSHGGLAPTFSPLHLTVCHFCVLASETQC